MSLQESNILREIAYDYIVDLIITGKFEQNFNEMSRYGKNKKFSHTETKAETDQNKQTLKFYQDEILNPITFRGMLTNDYHPD